MRKILLNIIDFIILAILFIIKYFVINLCIKIKVIN